MKKTAPAPRKAAPAVSASARLPKGYLASGTAAGLKASGAPDMGLLFSDRPAAVAGVFTSNQVKAAHVRLDAQRIATYGVAQAVIVNSGQANACTGKRGIADAKAVSAAAADALGIARPLALVCSTGRIGVPLDLPRMVPAAARLANALSPSAGEDFARAIMTTDTRPKRFTATFSVEGVPCRVTGFAKGAGMIEPNMGTMLAFLLTDAAVARPSLRPALLSAVSRSFNRVSVDGDRSTNDTALLFSNAAASSVPLSPSHPYWPAFAAALDEVCLRLAKAMAADGEGATKMVTVTVSSARSNRDADLAARAVANSMLVKTSWAGTYPNWGRVMDALGYSPAAVNETKVDIFYDGVPAVLGGVSAGTPQARLEKILAKPAFALDIHLHLGAGTATVYTCNCTEQYVVINKD